MALFELTELASLLKSDLDTATATQSRQLAQEYLEGELGVKLSQTTSTVTYVPRWDDSWIDLPVPTGAVTQVDVDGVTLDADDYKKVDNRLYRAVGWGGARWADESRFSYRSSDDDFVSVDVTMTWGFDATNLPGDLRQWALVLAAQVYQNFERISVQSERIDDYSITYATGGGQMAAIGLPGPVLAGLKSRYGGRGVGVVTPL